MIEQLEEEKHVNYITSVERIGMERGERTLLLRQLQHRFGSLPTHYENDVANADNDTLLRWGELLLDAKKLDDIFKAKH
jgi:hypothetical protein